MCLRSRVFRECAKPYQAGHRAFVALKPFVNVSEDRQTANGMRKERQMKRMMMVLVAVLSAALLPACSGTTTTVVSPNAGIDGVAALPTFEMSAQEIRASEAKVLAEADDMVAKIAALKPGETTFENSFVALDTARWLVRNAKDRFYLLKNVSPDEQVRNQAGASELVLNAWIVGIESRSDLYALLRGFADTAPALTGEDRRLLDETLRTYRRSGVQLPEATRQQIRAVKNELAAAEATILRNYNASAAEQFLITPEQASGTPEQLLALVPRDAGGNYVVTNANAGILLGYCPREETRRIVFEAVNSRGLLSNKAIMTEVIKKRARLAALLGYASWADCQTEIRMTGSARRALEFVQGLIDGLEPKFRAESEALRQLKADETGNPASRMESWDVSYYARMFQETRYHVDYEDLRKFFSLDTVLDGMFRTFETVFRLKIETVAPPSVWAAGVQLVRVGNAATGETLGYLYLDLFPRPAQGKFGHSALFPLASGKLLHGLVYQRPVAAIVCNLPEPGTDRPSLLSYSEVKGVLFHEFGHALHQILTTARYAAFSKIDEVPGDFLEVPSTLLEYWSDDSAVLGRFAVNYVDPADRLPADALKNIAAANKALIAHSYRDNLARCKMDLLLHSEIAADAEFDIVTYTNRFVAEGYYPYPEKSSYITSFGHIFAGGYDAGFYGYTWAAVIADDMASMFRNSPLGLLDAELGLKLRTEVLQQGNARNVHDSVAAFLGRPWNNTAFLTKLGIAH